MKRIIFNVFLFIAIFMGIFQSEVVFAQETESDCSILKSEIKDLVSECKTCETDEECFIDTSVILGCPFGCFFIRSTLYDDGEYPSLIEAKVKKYQENCPICKYKCPIPPEENEIGCRNNKCVDLQFFVEESKDVQLLLAKSYKEKWTNSPVEKHGDAVIKAKEALEAWGQNPEKYEFDGKFYDYEILVFESKNFLSVTFHPIGMSRTSQEVEIRMTKGSFRVLSILKGS